MDYQSVGSGSGKKSVIDHTVDFGASDAAMTDEEMARVPGGVQLLPMTAGAIVIAYNVDGVTGLKLSRKAYTGIFLGKIKKWNDPEIAAANPGVKLPDLPINVVVRADSSGTSFVFSKHLSAISEEFNKAVGANTMPNWPVGTKSKGNEGVTASLKIDSRLHWLRRIRVCQQPEAGHRDSGKQSWQVRGCLHRFGSGGAGFGRAARQPDRLGLRSGCPDAYPIVTYTWLICYAKYPDAKKLAALQDLLKYCLTDGQKDAEALGYIPLPANVSSKALAAVQTITN